MFPLLPISDLGYMSPRTITHFPYEVASHQVKRSCQGGTTKDARTDIRKCHSNSLSNLRRDEVHVSRVVEESQPAVVRFLVGQTRVRYGP